MSFRVFFDFSTGFKKALYFRSGTFDRVLMQVNDTERKLGIRREYYGGYCRWSCFPKFAKEVSDEVYCDTVDRHNDVVRWFYGECEKAKAWKTKDRPEKIDPYKAQNLFIGLKILSVPPEKWTREYYQRRMDAMYSAMRGSESEGISFDSKPLTVAQARDVIVLFSAYLDKHDIRLEVCRGHDHLTNSYSEGYFWCGKCGAVAYEDLPGDFDTNNQLCAKCNKKYVRLED